jgi:hypothetical protein
VHSGGPSLARAEPALEPHLEASAQPAPLPTPTPPPLAPCRLLELTGAKEPAALERLVKSVGAKPESVNKDLLLYKGILSKLAAAKVRLPAHTAPSTCPAQAPLLARRRAGALT